MKTLNINNTHVLSQLASTQLRKEGACVDITRDGTPFIAKGSETDLHFAVAVKCSEKDNGALRYEYGDKGAKVVAWYKVGLELTDDLASSLLHFNAIVIR